MDVTKTRMQKSASEWPTRHLLTAGIYVGIVLSSWGFWICVAVAAAAAAVIFGF